MEYLWVLGLFVVAIYGLAWLTERYPFYNWPWYKEFLENGYAGLYRGSKTESKDSTKD